MVFKTFDCAYGVEGQDFKEHSYDLVVASNVLSITANPDDTIKHCRQLLKPGGHLILLEVTTRLQNWMSLVLGTWSGRWGGLDDNGHSLGSFVPVSDWEKIFLNNKFSAVETCTTSSLQPLSLFSTRAMSPKMQQLIHPLDFAIDDQTTKNTVIVIGGTKSVSARILEQLQIIIPDRDIQVFADFSDLVDFALPAQSTFLVLSELDNELFANLDEDRFEGVKTMLLYARNVLWLNEDAYTEHPYQCMINGLFRTLRLEYPDIQVQIIDVEDASTFSARELATWLLRLEASYGMKLSDALWTYEYEIRIENGVPLVPRLKSDIPRNDRYNSLRRNIYSHALPGDVPLILTKHEANYGFQVDEDDFLSSLPKPNYSRLRVQFSMPQAIRLGQKGYFYMIVGQIIDTSELVYAFSSVNASMVEVPNEWTTPCDLTSSNNLESSLLNFVGELFAKTILESTPRGTSLVIHEPATFLQEPLIQHAFLKGVVLKFTTVSQATSIGKLWINLHARATQRLIASSLPAKLSTFINMSDDSEPGNMAGRLVDSLPPSCKVFTAGDYVQEDSAVLCEVSDLAMADYLMFARSSQGSLQAKTVSTSDISESKNFAILGLETVVDWSSPSSVAVKIRPVDTVLLFEDQKTYVLIGLTGDLGRSLCRWMIGHGARYVVLCSRNPKIDDRWVEMMALEGAVVAVKSL